MRSPEEWLTELSEFRKELGDAVVMGAVAALQYRNVGRHTKDLDLLVPKGTDVEGAAHRQGFDTRPIKSVDGDPFMYVVTTPDGLRIDVVIAEIEFQREALGRATDGYLSVEDVIVHKLIAWRPHDRDDVLSILHAGHELDQSYIGHWANEWNVMNRWQQALEEFSQAVD